MTPRRPYQKPPRPDVEYKIVPVAGPAGFRFWIEAPVVNADGEMERKRLPRPFQTKTLAERYVAHLKRRHV